MTRQIRSPAGIGALLGLASLTLGLSVFPDGVRFWGPIGGVAIAGAVAAHLSDGSPQNKVRNATTAGAPAALVAALAMLGSFVLGWPSMGAFRVLVLGGNLAGTAVFVLIVAATGAGTLVTLAERLRAEVGDGILSYPVLAGAAVGLLTGTAGLLGLPKPYDFLGAMSGAVWGGVTASALSPGARRTAVWNALLADGLSSIAFFLGVWLVFAIGSGRPFLVVGTPVYVIFGSIVAVPVALFSLGIAGASGFFTAVVRDSTLSPRR